MEQLGILMKYFMNNNDRSKINIPFVPKSLQFTERV